jgi:Aspartyl/Asparaginyl beta-hydroxylase
MSTLLTRKQLPAYGKIQKTFDIASLREYCIEKGYTDYEQFNSIQYGGNNLEYILSNAHCKDEFFLEEGAESLQGEKYKQFSLTDIKPEAKINDEKAILESGKTYKQRMRRLDPSRPEYTPEADHYNYGVPNEHFAGEIAKALGVFEAELLRVKLAVLMPGFTIRPHVDFDTSYLVRYHFPIITNDDVRFGARLPNGEKIEYNMPADGSIYFFNGGLLHWVGNHGTEPRLHLIADVKGQQDLKLQ